MSDPCARLTPAEIGRLDRGVTTLAIAIALAESGGRPCAVNRNRNGSVDVGLWQINTTAHPQYDPERLKEPLYNAQAMLAISNGGTDWTPWVAYTTGRYQEHEAAVMDAALDELSQTRTKDLLGTAGDVVGGIDPFSGWARQAMTLVLVAVFVAGGLALLSIGASKLTGVTPETVMSKAGPAAAAASFVA